ncbi:MULTISPECIES: transglycosylase SLT domain-containing protein [Zoogloea]|jgi:soluble lytic murein transglycosylase-like protein|uniref:Transglycosylase n=1 Tax=Zoogloea oleivorans TaxID=1552750 RepID=A0A6C2D8E9_9RHOO|nr:MULTISPECIES: transglycosylase SLT domain-containing protein [Zoogloea]MBT9498806.1 transglycosylase SLT domain-containing protein [Zoogloea sp.]MDD2667516.1 transglycosylase SLT domain-containing protein [Zoogloea sp.]MDY0036025.1 transglycosylase SLT domain-containing protein [Zoogloea oleivorans]TYC62234.1 transglycosylase [Zoogloea oleivorans]
MFATRIAKYARHAASFMLHFAHGGLLVAGLIVTLFVASRIANHGVQGLSLGSLTGESSASAVIDEPEVDVIQVAENPSSQLSPDLQRVKTYVAKRYQVSAVALEPLLAAAQQTGRSVGVDPLLLVAVMAIESRFNPFAESPMGAQGLMQVIPKWHPDKIDVKSDKGAMFDPDTNIRVGALVLKEYIKSTGSIEMALQKFNGSSDPSAPYANKVMAVKAQLSQAARSGSRFVGV